MHREATVTVCHILTKDLKEHTQKADVLFSGCGVAHLIGKDHLKEGCVVVDIGINRLKDDTKKRGYRLVGDVDYDAVFDKVGSITPVPGGVGPMTISQLIEQTINLANNNLKLKTNRLSWIS